MTPANPSLIERLEAAAREKEAKWCWRNTRSFGVSVALWPLEWYFGVTKAGDVYGMDYRLDLGPIHLSLSVSIGNASNRFTPWALCEIEAYERALADGEAAP